MLVFRGYVIVINYIKFPILRLISDSVTPNLVTVVLTVAVSGSLSLHENTSFHERKVDLMFLATSYQLVHHAIAARMLPTRGSGIVARNFSLKIDGYIS
jgi:hypothetical protein